jgi:hypothetical protein
MLDNIKKMDIMTNNDLQNIKQKSKDRATRTQIKTGVEFRCSGRVSDCHVRWCSYHLAVSRRVSYIEQELLTRPEHLNSTPVFIWVRVARSLDFCLIFCRSLFVIMSIFFIFFICRGNWRNLRKPLMSRQSLITFIA